jgi:Flp pilus assembly protein TadG
MSIKGTQRRGAVLPLVPFLVLISAGVAILMVDLGHITATRSRAQTAADAAALAGAQRLRQQYYLPVQEQIAQIAIDFSEHNEPDFANALIQSDVILGKWDPEFQTFTPDVDHMNAVKTIIHVNTDVLFSSIFGGSGKEVNTSAIAAFTVYEDSFTFEDEFTKVYLCNDVFLPLGEHEHHHGHAHGN